MDAERRGGADRARASFVGRGSKDFKSQIPSLYGVGLRKAEAETNFPLAPGSPRGAGLSGGSADALRLLSSLPQCGIPSEVLESERPCKASRRRPARLGPLRTSFPAPSDLAMLPNTGKLRGCTLFITGASRGIGKAIALKAAKDGANIVIAAKTGVPHRTLPGTIYTAAEEIEAAGGKALPCIVNVREEEQIVDAVNKAVQTYGGIDVLVNNASAISLTGTLETPTKKVDLMMSANTRGTYLTLTKSCRIPAGDRQDVPEFDETC
ncbi:UNVERIFIED_CONTAM: hypothetical protein K2H54_035712 [Gekko kuhli]